MSEEQNIEDQSTDDRPQSTEENFKPLTDPQLQTTNQQLQTENMEVHKHLHHVTQKKKWGEYLLEFFMLFLAVFLGFIAENVREHVVENEKAKQFAISLLSDIKADTAALNTAISYGNKKVKAIDSLIAQIEQLKEKWKDTLIYTYSGLTARIRPFGNNSGTYEQMKTSGSLRYFKQGLTDLLNQYDVQAKKTKVREDIHLYFAVNVYNPFSLQIMDARAIIQIQDGFIPTHALVFRKSDKETVALWINYATVVQSTQQRVVVEYDDMLAKAKQIIAALQKEYHL